MNEKLYGIWKLRHLVLAGFVLFMTGMKPVYAGMPSVRLTPEATNHLSGISTAIFGVLLVASLLIFICWNIAVRGTTFPKISYWKSLAIAILGGFLFCLVLVMIAGSRELLTPGAWKQKGVLYELSDKPKELSATAAFDPVTFSH